MNARTDASIGREPRRRRTPTVALGADAEDDHGDPQPLDDAGSARRGSASKLGRNALASGIDVDVEPLVDPVGARADGPGTGRG